MAKTTMYYGSYKFDPVPLLSISKSFERSPSTDRIFTNVELNLNGFIVSNEIKGLSLPIAPSGSPGTRIGDLDAQADALYSAFLQDNQNFIIHDASGYVVLSEFPRVTSINLDEGLWYDTIPYSITLTYEDQVASGISSFDESWSYQENEGDDNLVTVTHTISAVGINDSFDPQGKSAFQNAKDYVLQQLNNGLQAPFFIDQLNGSGKENRVKSEEINVPGGSYSITETFVYADGTYTEIYDVSTEVGEDQSISATINGTVTGWGENRQEKFINASGAWPYVSGLALPRVLSLVDESNNLNTNALTYSIGKDPYAGIITYSFAFDDREEDLAKGVAKETINIQFNLPKNVFATHIIPGRAGGPILQNIGTVSESIKSVSVARTYQKSHVASGGAVGFDFGPYEPSGLFSDFYVSTFDEAFNVTESTYTASKAWTYVGIDSRRFNKG